MFGSDNQYGAHPAVLEAMVTANEGIVPSYGADAISQKARKLISEIFETDDLDIYFVATGGAANCINIGALCPNWGAVLCHAHAHIYLDEGNGPEMISGGARIIGIGDDLKLLPNDIEKALKNHSPDFVHAPQPKLISITNLNENGIIYSIEEILEIAKIAKKYDCKLHCDGARFANALIKSGATPKDLSWNSGIDALSFGLTKNGAVLAEAVLIFGSARNQAAKYIQKTAQQTISKNRFLAAQFVAMLENNLWLKNAQNANRIAQGLKSILERYGVEIICPVDGNEVFAKLDNATIQALTNANITFYPWHALGENIYRFVTSWANNDADLTKLEHAFHQAQS